VTSEIYLHKRGRELTCWRRRREVAWCTLSSVSSSLLLVFLLCLSVLVLSLFLSVFSVFSLCRPGLPCFSFVLVFLSFPGFFLVFALLSAFLSFLFFQPSVPSLCVFFFFFRCGFLLCFPVFCFCSFSAFFFSLLCLPTVFVFWRRRRSWGTLDFFSLPLFLSRFFSLIVPFSLYWFFFVFSLFSLSPFLWSFSIKPENTMRAFLHD